MTATGPMVRSPTAPPGMSPGSGQRTYSPGATAFFLDTGLPAPVSAGAGRAVGPELVFGDTLNSRRHGATVRSHSIYETIIESIRGVLFELPDATVELTRHGGSTSIGA